jgi:prolyl oligopeptidase
LIRLSLESYPDEKLWNADDADAPPMNADNPSQGVVPIVPASCSAARHFHPASSAFIGGASAFIGVSKAFCLAIALSVAHGAQAAEPAAEDPFRYLEDPGDARTQAFFREQGASARQMLDAIPGRAAMLARIRALSEGETTVTQLAVASSRTFYLKLQPREATAVLCMREGVAGAERVLVDPSRYDQGERRAAVDWFAPSPDGRHVAFGVSTGGSEDSTLRVIAVDGGALLPLEIDRTRFNERLSWHPDSRAFYYARIPEGNAPGRRYANIRVYRHVLGRDTDRDEIVFASGVGGARDVPEFVYPSIHLPIESRYAYAIARDGVRPEIAVHSALQRDLAAGRPRWRKIAGHADEVLAVEGWRSDLYLLSAHGAPRHRVLRMKGGDAGVASARVVVPQGESVIQAFGIARDALYLKSMVGGVDRLERVILGLLGPRPPQFVRIPFDNAISQLVTHPRIAGALIRIQGWIEPPAVMQVEAGSGNVSRTPIQPPPAADFSEMDEVRLYAPGHDGVKIPVTLIYRKTTRLDRTNPTLVTAYGSYGITLAPRFDPANLAWLERGGVFAVAHVRGGGEYGREWHQAGRGPTKANTILDAIAVSEFLVSYGFTNPRRLAIQGVSAGGIAAGGALVRKPGLFAAVVGRVPLMDMLRFEASANGPANAPEFGTTATPEGLAALRQMSAYHLVKDATAYPAVLLTAGMNDPRVDAWQPGKMAARLQAASISGLPVLLRVDMEGGHGPGATRAQREEALADVFSFLLWQLGDPQFQPPPPPIPLQPPSPDPVQPPVEGVPARPTDPPPPPPSPPPTTVPTQ